MEPVSTKGSGVEKASSSPETRYTELHRHLEAGANDEKTLADLARACLDLGKDDEALEAYHKLVSFGPKTRIHTLLVEKGLLSKDDAPPELEAQTVTDDDMQPTLAEAVSDAMQFVVGGRIPVAAITTMVAFGTLLGIGGIVHKIAGIVVATLSTLPVAVVLFGLVAAVSVRILMASAHGFSDPPDLPTRNEAIREAKTGGANLLVASAMLLTPGVLVYWITGFSVVSALLLLIGWGLLPLVFVIRQLTTGWREAAPKVWWKVLTTTHPHVTLATLVNVVMFAPAALTMNWALDRSAYLGVCFIGLLSVVPLFASARMLGQVLFYQRKKVGKFLDLEPGHTTTS